MSEQTKDVRRETGNGTIYRPRLGCARAEIMVNLQVYRLPSTFANREVRVHTDDRGKLVKVTTLAGTRVNAVKSLEPQTARVSL